MAKEKADEAQSQADAVAAKAQMMDEVSKTIHSWITIYNNAQSHYEQLVGDWQLNGLTQRSNFTFEPRHSRVYTPLRLSPRSHNGSHSPGQAAREFHVMITSDNDKFLATLTRAKDHLDNANQSARSVRDKSQSLSAFIADIDRGSLVPLFGDLATWTDAKNAQITGL